MVNLKKQVDKPEKFDEDFIARLDDFIQEMHDLKNKSRPAKTDDDRIFYILLYILWAEMGILLGLDIVMFIRIFSD